MKKMLIPLFAALLVMTGTACVGSHAPSLRAAPPVPGASLWTDPTDLASRDFYNGPWGAEHAPSPHATYTFVKIKHTGVNPGMTVADAQGREWSVKQGDPGGLDDESPVEVVISRLLSGVGYHQPPVYLLPSFVLKDDWGTHTERRARFRLKAPSLKEVSDWKWGDNPFIGTPAYEGLLVMMMMFNSTDLKDSNNSIYEYRRGDRVQRWYVVSDLGAALGEAGRFAPRKNHIGSFERTPFLIGMNGPYADFAFTGRHRELVDNRISLANVRWASALLSRLSDKQWQDAFRAGGFDAAVAKRYIRRLKGKIGEGLALKPARRVAAAQ